MSHMASRNFKKLDKDSVELAAQDIQNDVVKVATLSRSITDWVDEIRVYLLKKENELFVRPNQKYL